MRILAIRGADLASLAGPFAVELDHPPLDRAGLFAIAGPTGAGKSTVLDALCLALYDRVPRLEGSANPQVGRAREAEEMRIRANDVRGLLRRGAGSGWAEVDFRGRDGRRWRARWEVHRARRRPEGRLQDQQMSLVDAATGEAVGRTRTEVLEAVADRVGLSWDQFRRSVLLAQGEFAAFLRAPAGERAALLERLTGTELYGRVSIAAHERARKEAGELDTLAARLSDTAPLAEDERASLEARRTEAAAALVRAREAERGARTARDWHRQRDRLEASVREAETDAASAETAWQEAQPRRAELEAVRAAEAVRSPVDAADAAEHTRAGRRARSATLDDDAAGADRALAEATTALVAAEEEERATAEALESERPRLDLATRLDVELESSARELAAAVEAERGVRERVAAATARRREAADGVDRAERGRDGARAWLEAHRHLAQLAAEWPRWRELLGRLRRARDEAAAAATGLAGMRERLDAARADTAAALRAGLAEGEPCPVCGSTEHPWAGRGGSAAGAGDWRTLDGRRAELEAVLARAERESEETRAVLAAAAAAMPGGADALDDDLRDVAERWSAQVESWQARVGGLHEAEAALAEARPRLTAAESELGAAEQAASEAASALGRRQEEHARRTEERSALLGGEATSAVRSRLESAASAARRAAAQARERRVAAANAAERARALAEGGREELETAEATAAAARGERDARLAEAGLDLEEVRPRLARPRGWIAAEQAALATLEEGRSRARTVLEERRARLRDHESTGAPAIGSTEAEAELRGATAAVDLRQRALTELEARLESDRERRERAADLAARYAVQRTRADLWAGLRELVGSHDGAKLRTFAQGLTLDALLAHANHHLVELARRYRLERIPGSDLELQVVDREMADEVRAVQSLSGGESFLVSLALALGLASLASSRVAVESLFVDEGFGSLDPDALDAALAGLDALQALGRQVGVISHVPTMVERIGVQVLVEPSGGGRSRVRVVDASGGTFAAGAREAAT